MAECNLKDHIDDKMETSSNCLQDNNIIDNTMNPSGTNIKRSRDNSSEDEANEICTKKPRHEESGELIELETGNINSISKPNGIATQRNTENKAVEKNNVSEGDKLLDAKSEKDVKLTLDEKQNNDNNASLIITNHREKSKSKSKRSSEPEIFDGLELSVECASDNESSESDKNDNDEKETEVRPKTIIVKSTPNDSELEMSETDSEKSETNEKSNGANNYDEKMKNNRGKKLSSSVSNNSENNDGDNDDKKSNINYEKSSPKNNKTFSDTEQSDKNDCNDDTKLDSIKKTDDARNDGCVIEDTDHHQTVKNEKKLYTAKKKGAKKSQDVKKAFHDPMKENEKSLANDEMSDHDDQHENIMVVKKSSEMKADDNNEPTEKMDESEDSSTSELDDGKATSKDEKKKRTTSKFEDKIEYMKKFIKAAGIRVKKYDDLWLNCKTEKQKIERLKELLEKNGISGRPTLEKCKAAKAKREQDREIAELDPKNIICEGRVTRSRRSFMTKQSPLPSSPQRKVQSRIKYVVDSDSE